MTVLLQPRILRVPYEEGTFWRKGAKDGPDAVMREFAKLRDFSLREQRMMHV